MPYDSSDTFTAKVHGIRSLVETHQSHRIRPTDTWKQIRPVLKTLLADVGNMTAMAATYAEVANLMATLAGLFDRMADDVESRSPAPIPKPESIPEPPLLPSEEGSPTIEPDEAEPDRGKSKKHGRKW